jgi:hypothetical protein
MSPSGLVAPGSIREYFGEAVRAALEYLRFQPNQETTAYLIELLCEYARAAAAVPDRPLAMVMAEAQLADPASSIGGLKRVGDHSLYLAGYFGDSLVSRRVDPAYYGGRGSGAYHQLRRVLRRRRHQTRLVVVYRELGDDFTRFARVLSEVRAQGDAVAPPRAGELGELYDEWLRTGSEGARRRLQAAGILVVRRPGPRQ